MKVSFGLKHSNPTYSSTITLGIDTRIKNRENRRRLVFLKYLTQPSPEKMAPLFKEGISLNLVAFFSSRKSARKAGSPSHFFCFSERISFWKMARRATWTHSYPIFKMSTVGRAAGQCWDTGGPAHPLRAVARSKPRIWPQPYLSHCFKSHCNKNLILQIHPSTLAFASVTR